jgi:hypothetical protein
MTAMRDARLRGRKLLPPLLVVLLTAAAIAGVTLLVERADASRRAQLGIASATLALTDLQSAPFNADSNAGGSPAAAAKQIRSDRRTISERLTLARDAGAPAGTVSGGRADLAAVQPSVSGIYALAIAKGGLARRRREGGDAAAAADRQLGDALASADDARPARVREGGDRSAAGRRSR